MKKKCKCDKFFKIYKIIRVSWHLGIFWPSLHSQSSQFSSFFLHPKLPWPWLLPFTLLQLPKFPPPNKSILLLHTIVLLHSFFLTLWVSVQRYGGRWSPPRPPRPSKRSRVRTPRLPPNLCPSESGTASIFIGWSPGTLSSLAALIFLTIEAARLTRMVVFLFWLNNFVIMFGYLWLNWGLIGIAGDVLLHCVVDAILGALGLPDIGQIFPDSDPKWKGAPSSVFIKEAVSTFSSLFAPFRLFDSNDSNMPIR